MSRIRQGADPAAGLMKVGWAKAHMPVLSILAEEFAREKVLEGLTVGICLHLEAKTACLALALQDAGARVGICGSNPLSTQDDVAAALASSGVEVFAWHNPDKTQYLAFIHDVLDLSPDIVIDDGGDLVSTIHTERRELIGKVIGGCEETTTGLRRLRAMERRGELAFPMVAVNDAKTKFLFDNRYGTGQSVWDGIMRTTNLVVAGKTVVVAGYGWCGKGVANRARGLGARVVITEVDPVKAAEAYMEGFLPMHSLEAAEVGDIFITVTGCANVFSKPHFARMKDGALLANAGHFNVEIDLSSLDRIAKARCRVRPNVDEYTLPDGKRLYVLAEGRLVNLASGDGHPVEIMDLSFAVQMLSVAYLATEAKHMPPRVLPVPEWVDQRVALAFLKARSVRIDTLSEEQQRYYDGAGGEDK